VVSISDERLIRSRNLFLEVPEGFRDKTCRGFFLSQPEKPEITG
jgi:hypothetical protein